MSAINLTNLLSHGAIRLPWPIHTPSETYGGDIGINAICKTKCSSYQCKSISSTSIGTACHLGLTTYEVPIGPERVKIFGVVGPSQKEKLPKHQDFKAACKGRSVSPGEVQEWADSIRSLLSNLENDQNVALATALEPLHDAMRLAKDVSQLADKLIYELPGTNLTERFDCASATQKALVKSANLLEDTFDLLEIYLNPAAVKFGQPRSIELYKLIDKLSRIASIARSSQIRPRVRIEGNTRRILDLYESFKLIPFCLIDNAQKYSRQGSEVIIRVQEESDGVIFEFRSEGLYIEPNDQKLIFTRGYRSVVAQSAYPSGMGVGLYVSDIVARAHGTKILVSSQDLGYQINGIEQATNIFSIKVKSINQKISHPNT